MKVCTNWQRKSLSLGINNLRHGVTLLENVRESFFSNTWIASVKPQITKYIESHLRLVFIHRKAWHDYFRYLKGEEHYNCMLFFSKTYWIQFNVLMYLQCCSEIDIFDFFPFGQFLFWSWQLLCNMDRHNIFWS